MRWLRTSRARPSPTRSTAIVNIGGPQKISFEQMARDSLARRGDDKTVVVDPTGQRTSARLLDERSLVTPD